MASNLQLVFTTIGSTPEAEALGRRLVEEGLAACATLLPGAVSIYEWKGKRERTEECVLLLKTTRERLAELEARVLELHDYECPEFVAVSAEHASPSYAAWVGRAVAS